MRALQQCWTVLGRVPRLVGLLLVRGYQIFLSPLLPQTCRFYPSCSAYGVTAITRHGLLWGVALTAWRLLRCNPWNRGGVDDVPEHGFTGADGVGRRSWRALTHTVRRRRPTGSAACRGSHSGEPAAAEPTAVLEHVHRPATAVSTPTA